MAWLAKDEDGSEFVYNEDLELVFVPTGTIFRLIGRELSWQDEPVELTEGALFQPFSADMLNFLLVNSLRFLTEEQRKMLVESLVKPVTDKEIEKQAETVSDGLPSLDFELGFIVGAKWMRERMSR
jgi:hypothetical protein